MAPAENDHPADENAVEDTAGATTATVEEPGAVAGEDAPGEDEELIGGESVNAEDDIVVGGDSGGEGTDGGEEPFGADLEQMLDQEGEEIEQEEEGDGTFDFSRPHDISKAFEQNLRSVGENLAKMASVSFTNLFRANSSLEFTGLKLLGCGEYLAKLGNPTCISTVTLSPLQGRSLIHLELGLCFALLKKLMGGATEQEEMLREFTEIERHIFGNLIQRLLDLLKGASSRLVTMEPAFSGLENNPDYVTGVATGDTLAVLKFQFKLDTQAGRLEIGFPMSAFAPVRDIFDPQERREMRSPQEVKRDRHRVMETLQSTQAEIVIKLTELEAKLEQMMQLQEGDIFNLGQPVDAPLVVEVEGKPVFLAEAGRVHQKRAVKLTERISEE